MFSRASRSSTQTALVTTSASAAAESTAPSILAADVTIEGSVESAGELHIEGRVDGQIRASVVVVGETGRVFGEVHGGTVIVRGLVSGLIAGDRVYLTGSSKVVADVHHDVLCIDEGAAFEGQCRRVVKRPPKAEEPEPLSLPGHEPA